MKVGMCIAALAVMMSGCSNRYHTNENTVRKQTLVFVHGAHLTADSWSDTANILKNKGFNTVAVNLPGRSKSDDPNTITLHASSQALCDAIKPINTPIVLVTHSQGGAVAHHALSICPQKNINSIVYVTSVAPAHGNKPFARLSKADEVNYFKGVSFDEKSGWMKINNQAAFASVFTNSTSNAIKHKVISQSVNEPAVIGEGVVHYDTDYFATLKKYYIHTKFDKVISLESQQKIAGSIALDGSAMLETGHLPMVTAPDVLANHIATFVN